MVAIIYDSILQTRFRYFLTLSKKYESGTFIFLIISKTEYTNNIIYKEKLIKIIQNIIDNKITIENNSLININFEHDEIKLDISKIK